jgi:hypothetical protein
MIAITTSNSIKVKPDRSLTDKLSLAGLTGRLSDRCIEQIYSTRMQMMYIGQTDEFVCPQIADDRRLWPGSDFMDAREVADSGAVAGKCASEVFRLHARAVEKPCNRLAWLLSFWQAPASRHCNNVANFPVPGNGL